MSLFPKKVDFPSWKIGLAQATGVVAYIMVIIGVMSPLSTHRVSEAIAPLMMMLLFSTSVLVCGILVFYRPYTLFFVENKKAEAAQAVVWTAGWLAAFLLVVITSAFLFALE